jgi:hypothetical protein
MRKFFIATAVAVVALFFSASSADAGFTVTLHETGFTDQTFTLTSGQLNDLGTQTIGDYNVTVSARDSAPGISTLFGGALVSQNTFTVTSSSAPAANLVITVKDDTFSSAPYGSGNSVTVINSLSTTEISNGTVTAHGFLTNSGNTATVSTTDLSLTGPTLSGSVSNSASGSVSPIGSTFTLGNVSTVHFNGTAGGEANFTVTTVAPVPAPAGVVLALTGLPLLGIGAWMRRRLQMARGIDA